MDHIKPEQFGKLNSEYIDYVAQKIADEYEESGASAEKMSADIAALQTLVGEQKTALVEQGAVIDTLKSGSVNPDQKKADNTKQYLKNIVKAVRNVMKGIGGVEAFVTKADTTTASVVDNGNASDLTDVGQLAYRMPTFLNLLESAGRVITVPPNANGTVRYIDWDESTKVRAAAMVAEGDTFPESKAVWETKTIKLKKVADTIPWTDEFEYDDNFLVDELRQFLRVNLMLEKGTQVVNGDGTGNNLDGIVNASPAYTAAASSITDASIYDLIVKLREAIEADQGSKYRTNFALMNIVDINKYKLKKDANNNYIMPPFYDAAGNRIDGVTVLEDNNIATNTMVVGDVNYIRFYMQAGVGIETGYINDDFTTGKKRMRVHERCLFLIREVDKTGFRKVTDIAAALVTLAS